MLKITSKVRNLVRQFGVLYQDIILIHPTRILRRKNIEYGIRVLAELKKLGKSAVYIVTGAPDPHNAASREYGQELKKLVSELEVEREFSFRKRAIQSERRRSAQPLSRERCALSSEPTGGFWPSSS